MSGLKQCAVPKPPNPNIWEFCFEISSSLHPILVEEIENQPECFSELIFESYPHPLYAPYLSYPNRLNVWMMIWRRLDLLINLDRHIHLQGALLLIKTALLLVPRRRTAVVRIIR